tara:strand:- start:1124 stop:1531 length:408 start_codon:yes stop_codon:yes gene_type:complete
MGRLKDSLIDQMDRDVDDEYENYIVTDNNFSKFHRNNLKVFHLIVQYADESAKKRNRYSIEDILSIIRWHRDEDTVGDIFKLNNNYKAYYGRMYMQYRNKPDFFETRNSLADRYDFSRDIEIYCDCFDLVKPDNA